MCCCRVETSLVVDDYIDKICTSYEYRIIAQHRRILNKQQTVFDFRDADVSKSSFDKRTTTTTTTTTTTSTKYKLNFIHHHRYVLVPSLLRTVERWKVETVPYVTRTYSYRTGTVCRHDHTNATSTITITVPYAIAVFVMVSSTFVRLQDQKRVFICSPPPHDVIIFYLRSLFIFNRSVSCRALQYETIRDNTIMVVCTMFYRVRYEYEYRTVRI